MMKNVVFAIFFLLALVINAHRLLGSWTGDPMDQIPIEKHLSIRGVEDLEHAIDELFLKQSCSTVNVQDDWHGYFCLLSDLVVSL